MKKYKGIFNQFSKFVVVGILNTCIDFAILNLLFCIFEPIHNTVLFLIFKSISFIIAVINSYYLNKKWTFNTTDKDVKRFIHFLIVSIIGLVINTFIATFIFHTYLISHPAQIHLATNIGALVGAATVFIWNFLMYKFFIFERKSRQVI